MDLSVLDASEEGNVGRFFNVRFERKNMSVVGL